MFYIKMDFCRQQMRIKAIFIVCKSRLIGTAIIHTRAVELAGWASPAAAQLRSDGTTQTDRQTDGQEPGGTDGSGTRCACGRGAARRGSSGLAGTGTALVALLRSCWHRPCSPGAEGQEDGTFQRHLT